MRIVSIAALAIGMGGPAFSHPGHLVDVAGHGHWLGAAAAGAAIAIAIWAGLRGNKGKSEATDDADEASEDDAADAEEQTA